MFMLMSACRVRIIQALYMEALALQDYKNYLAWHMGSRDRMYKCVIEVKCYLQFHQQLRNES